jgi:hypothetical protein
MDQDNSKLVDGKIPAYMECPFRGKCEIAKENICNHRGVFHNVMYSCASARAFDLIEAYRRDAEKKESGK